MDTPQVFGVRSANCQRQRSLLIFSREIKLCLGHLTSKVGYLGTHPGSGLYRYPDCAESPG